ncbi:MAG: acetylglutamate kinase [Pseudobdellovibrionaceae bacterium]
MKKRIVVKLGGSSLENPGTVQELVTLIGGYRKENYEVILVHGGGPAINQELTRRGIEWKFIKGQRQTTPEMMEAIEEVLAKKINSRLVSLLHSADIPAVGLSGAQDQTLFCTQADAELMQVGKIESVNLLSIENILQLELGPTPVIAPLGVGANNEKYNINADWAAAQIAIALQAEKLIFLTDQNGILDQDKKLVYQVTPQRIHQMIEDQVISGGMYTKVMTMMRALNSGIQQVRVLNANVASQLLNNDRVGSLLSQDPSPTRKEVMEWNQKMN